jgi:membrane-associated phospholipid phosphatase
MTSGRTELVLSCNKLRIRRVTKIRLFLIIAWMIALAAAFLLDRPVAQWVHDHQPVDKHVRMTSEIIGVLKRPGDFRFVLFVAIALGFFHYRRWAAALCLVASSLAVGAVYSLVKWVVGRHRPVIEVAPFRFHPFAQGFPGIWREKALCFPSGHSMLAFASATCLAMLLPRWRIFFFAIALITAVERVIENAHYLSDVVAGAGVGILTAYWITRTLLTGFPDRRAAGELKT